MLKRTLRLGGLIGPMAALVFAASASGSIKATCAASAEVKNLTKDGSAKIPLGSEGKFTFSDIVLNCVGDSNKDAIPEVASVTARATGWYEVTLCSVGKSFGTVTAVFGGPAKYQVLVGKKFAVEVAGTNGLFYWHDWDKPELDLKPIPADPQDPSKDAPAEKTYSLAGAFQGSGSQQKPVPTPEEFLEKLAEAKCTKAFHIDGVLELDFES